MKLQKTQVHVVKTGETLSLIARSHGFSDWKKVYYASVNEEFRKRCPNPNQIRPGDQIFVPADSRVVAGQLRSRLEKLQSVRKNAVGLLDQVESDLHAAYGKANETAQRVDMAALVSGVLVGQAGLVKSFRDTLKRSGDDLAKLNAQIVRDHFLSPTSHIATVVGLVGSVFDEPKETDGVAIAFGKIIMKSWADLWSPSYWAGRMAGKHPDQAFKEALDQIHASRQNLLASIDQRIAKNRTLLAQIERENA